MLVVADGGEGSGRKKRRLDPQRGADATMRVSREGDGEDKDDGAFVHSIEANESSMPVVRLHTQPLFSVSAT